MKKLFIALLFVSFIESSGYAAGAAEINGKSLFEKAFIDHTILTATGMTAATAVTLVASYFATRNIDEFDEPEAPLVWAKRHRLKIGIALAALVFCYGVAYRKAKIAKVERVIQEDEQLAQEIQQEKDLLHVQQHPQAQPQEPIRQNVVNGDVAENVEEVQQLQRVQPGVNLVGQQQAILQGFQQVPQVDREARREARERENIQRQEEEELFNKAAESRQHYDEINQRRESIRTKVQSIIKDTTSSQEQRAARCKPFLKESRRLKDEFERMKPILQEEGQQCAVIMAKYQGHQ